MLEYPKWTKTTINLDGVIHYGPNKYYPTKGTNGTEGHWISVNPAWYKMFDKETSLGAIYNIVTSFCQYQDALLASGNLQIEEVCH